MTAGLTCADTSGFLFSHPCDRLATGECATCAKPICVEHTRLTATGPRCVTCLRDERMDRSENPEHDSDVSIGAAGDAPPTVDQPPAPEGQFGGAGASTGWSPDQAAAAGMDPHFYGGPAAWAGQYSAADHAAFEPAAAPDDGDTDLAGIENDPGGS